MSSSFSRSRGTPSHGTTTTTLIAEQARWSRIEEKLDLANTQQTESHGMKSLQTDLQSIRDELSTLKQKVEQQAERSVSGGIHRTLRKLPLRLCVS